LLTPVRKRSLRFQATHWGGRRCNVRRPMHLWEEIDMARDWLIEGKYIEYCSCDLGCPCEAMADPTHDLSLIHI